MRNKYVIDGRRNGTTCHGIFLQIQKSHVTLVFGRFLNLKSIHSFFDCLENLRDLESTGIGRDCLSVRSAGSSYTGKVPDSHGRSLGAPEVLFKCFSYFFRFFRFHGKRFLFGNRFSDASVEFSGFVMKSLVTQIQQQRLLTLFVASFSSSGKRLEPRRNHFWELKDIKNILKKHIKKHEKE